MGLFDSLFSGKFDFDSVDTDTPNQGSLGNYQAPRSIDAVGQTYQEGYSQNHAVVSVRELSTGNILIASDRFIITEVSETRTMRNDPVFGFGQPLNQTSGRLVPTVFVFSGRILVNGIEGDFRNTWWTQWHKYWSVSAGLVGPKRGVSPYITDITYRNAIRSGYITQFRTGLTGDLPNESDFQFNMFLVSEAFA